MKRPFAYACLLFLATVVGFTPLVGCDGEVSFTTASLSAATMAKGTDSDSQPVGPTDQFEIDTPEIFCSVKLSNAPNDTEVLSEWVYIKGELEGVTDHVIDTFPVVTDGTRYLEFSMERPDGGWPVGAYELVLYVDGKEKVAVPFTVGGAVDSFTTTGASASLSEATMALGVDSSGRPISPTTTFETDTPEIFCSVLLSDAPEGTSLLSQWYYVGGEVEDVTNLQIDSVPLTASGTQYLQFSLTIPDAGWPQGEYKLVLYLDEKEEVTVPFTVGNATNPFTPAASGASLTEATMTLGVDSQSRPLNATTTFWVDTLEIFCSVRLNDAPAETEALAEWYYLEGELEDVTDLFIDSFGIVAEGTQYLQFSLEIPDTGWPRGNYLVVLYLDGAEQLSLPFEVT